MHADRLAFGADVALPAKRGAHFHGDARGHMRGKDAFAIGGVLLLEEFPTGHADHAALNARGFEIFVCFDAEAQLASAGHEDYLGLAALGVRENVSAFGDSGRRRVFSTIESGNGLAGEYEGSGRVDCQSGFAKLRAPLCSGCRLLLGHAVERTESPDQIAAIDSYDVAVGK